MSRRLFSLFALLSIAALHTCHGKEEYGGAGIIIGGTIAAATVGGLGLLAHKMIQNHINQGDEDESTSEPESMQPEPAPYAEPTPLPTTTYVQPVTEVAADVAIEEPPKVIIAPEYPGDATPAPSAFRRPTPIKAVVNVAAEATLPPILSTFKETAAETGYSVQSSGAATAATKTGAILSGILSMALLYVL